MSDGYVPIKGFPVDRKKPIRQRYSGDAKSVTDFYLEIAKGNVAGHLSIHKFGGNDAVGTSFEDIWSAGTAITFLTSAATVHAISSDATDNQAGVGARSIHVFGLNSSFVEVDEIITMHATVGTSAGDSSTTEFIRIYRSHVETVGAYGGTNAGNIQIIEDTGSSVQGYIALGEGQSETSLYTIPAGKKGYVKRISISMDTGKEVEVKMLIRENADAYSIPVSPERSVHHWHGLSTPVEEIFYAHHVLLAKTELHFEGLVSTGTAKIEVDYDLILVDNG